MPLPRSVTSAATIEVSSTPQPVGGHASLLVQNGELLRSVTLHEGASLTLGRAEPADVVVDNPSVSRVHARFSFDAHAVTVEDVGSTNGLLYADERVTRIVLEDGDSVQMGSVRVTLTGVRPPSEAARLSGWSTFRQSTHAEIERARTFSRPFSLLGLCSATAEGHGLLELASKLRRVDVATLHTPDLMLVLLPETPAVEAVELAQRVVSNLEQGLRASVASFPETGHQLEALLEQLVHTARGATPGQVVRCPDQGAPADDGGPVVQSEAMLRLYELVERVAPTTMPVLVLGETGAGKELVARALHDRGPRKAAPFVAVNCATIPANLIESVLFGHEKGAFTGAGERKLGVFEQAQQGTVFLDEVGELEPSVQAALLRVLETKRLTRVGATREIELDVRVVAATHRNLATMVSEGRFREDLMFRLDALTLKVPPLRERPDEIETLATRFLAWARTQWGCRPAGFSPEAQAALGAYAWPGNVRQLKNVVERAAVVCPGDEIGLDDLPEELAASVLRAAPTGERRAPIASTEPVPASSEPADRSAELDPDQPYEARVAAFEARLLRAALAQTGGNKTKAAELLQMPRRTLGSRLRALGLEG